MRSRRPCGRPIRTTSESSTAAAVLPSGSRPPRLNVPGTSATLAMRSTSVIQAELRCSTPRIATVTVLRRRRHWRSGARRAPQGSVSDLDVALAPNVPSWVRCRWPADAREWHPLGRRVRQPGDVAWHPHAQPSHHLDRGPVAALDPAVEEPLAVGGGGLAGEVDAPLGVRGAGPEAGVLAGAERCIG